MTHEQASRSTAPGSPPPAQGRHRSRSEAAGGSTPLFGRFNVRGTLMVGLLCSISMHLLLMVLAALVLVRSGGGGAEDGDRSGDVQLAVVTKAELEAMQSAASLPAVPMPSIDTPVPESMESIELAELDVSSMTSALSDRALEGLGAGELTGGSELSTGSSGSGSVSFFGAEAVGRRIAYVIDMSGSMASGGKIEAAQTELGRSLSELRAPMEFYVAMYNNAGYPLEGFEGWTEASRPITREARRAFAHRANQLGGTTYPAHAFQMVFALRPLPDAIFFMTDGDFSDQDISTEAILSLNRPHEIPIHCLTLVDRSAEDRMRRIANASGGTYTHIDGVQRGRR